MATGYTDSNGIWHYGEDDSEANFSSLLNVLADSTSAVISNPTFPGNVRLTNANDVTPTSTDHPLQIGASAGTNLRMDVNEIMTVNNGVGAALYVNVSDASSTTYIGNSAYSINGSGRVNATHYPYAVSAGSVTTSTTGNVTVTFPASRFSQGPMVNVTSVAGSNAVCMPYVATVNATSMTISLYTTAGARVAQQVQWSAIQMTSSSGAG